MKKQQIKLAFIGFLFSSLLNANSIITLGEIKERPVVDEGTKQTPVEDRIKGSTNVSPVFKSVNVSLSKENGKTHQIIIKKVSQAPLTCKLIRHEKTIESISKKKYRNLVFDIDTSKLKIDDKVVLSNKNSKTILELIFKK